MHIIVLEKEPTTLRGGQEFSLLDVCRGLSQRGHSITLLYTKEGDLLKQYRDFCNNLMKVNGYSLGRSSIIDIFNFFSDIWKVPGGENSVVYSNHYRDTVFGSTLALSKNIPFICHLRLPAPETYEKRQWIVGLMGVKQFIAVSNQTKFSWVQSGFKEKKIDVVYNGINLEVFKPSEKSPANKVKWQLTENTKVILYVGRLDITKGLETLIKAFALLLKRNVDVKLLIAGKPVMEGEEYKKSLEQLATDLGVEKYVDFLGHITDTVSLYQASDVTVLPSLWTEPFGRTIIESMACGTPVVASRIGGIPEILTGEFQSGLFEPGDEQDLSHTLNWMMSWRDKNLQLGAKCREHILEKFSLDKTVDGIEKVLFKVAK